jgi:predicted protein tyrosine phosphatase
MSPLIENVGKWDVRNGTHTNMGPDTVLIQIADPPGDFPVPARKFGAIHKFEFLDAEDNDCFPEEAKFTMEQAHSIVTILKDALYNDRNVIVHCTMGICRSGAVVEVAQMMGFTPTNRYRQPNLRVKSYLMQSLGWSYDQ